jgi:hypothetical protein
MLLSFRLVRVVVTSTSRLAAYPDTRWCHARIATVGPLPTDRTPGAPGVD